MIPNPPITFTDEVLQFLMGVGMIVWILLGVMRILGILISPFIKNNPNNNKQ